MSDRIEFSAADELRWEAMRDDEFFARQCPSTNLAGERCAFTIHLTGLHTWEQK